MAATLVSATVRRAFMMEDCYVVDGELKMSAFTETEDGDW